MSRALTGYKLRTWHLRLGVKGIGADGDREPCIFWSPGAGNCSAAFFRCSAANKCCSATCCKVLQHVAVILQHVAKSVATFMFFATCCKKTQHVAVQLFSAAAQRAVIEGRVSRFAAAQRPIPISPDPLYAKPEHQPRKPNRATRQRPQAARAKTAPNWATRRKGY